MSADGKTPLPIKRYYDFFSYVVTQLAFSFTTAPFVLLTIHDSFLVWSRVYFYCIIGTIACSVFLITPGKQWLQSQVKAKNRPAMARADSHDGAPTLGLPNDPGKAWDEMVEEITNEIDARRKKGIPITGDLRTAGLKLGKDV
jgi:lysophospholipid acyltransferase